MLKGCDEPFLSPGTEHSSHEWMEKSWDSPILGYSFVDRLIFHSNIVNKACLLHGDDSSLIMLNISNSMLGCYFPCALPKRAVSALHSSICWKKASNTITLLLLPPPLQLEEWSFCLKCEGDDCTGGMGHHLLGSQTSRESSCIPGHLQHPSKSGVPSACRACCRSGQ